MPDLYSWDCGCWVNVSDDGVIETKRCEYHKKKYPHRLDEEKS